MADVEITGRPNGPYMVQGAVSLKDGEGNEISVEGDPIFLCRCGQSSNKPFCDGTHRDNGFEG